MNWHERIDRAEKRKYFSKKDIDLALEWPTCACSEQDPRIPRTGDGQPLDDWLNRLGAEFACDVNDGDFQEARITIAAIEARATELLKEIAA